MKSIIYYFSGTGNSYYLAKKTAEGIDSKLESLTCIKDCDNLYIEEHIIGLVFPVYYCDTPNIIREFLTKVSNLENKYVFAVNNYSGSADLSKKSVETLLKCKGSKLSAFYGVHMPQNAFYKRYENKNKIFARADKMIVSIINRTKAKKKGFLSTNIIINLISLPIVPLLNPTITNALKKLSGITGSRKEMIYNADKSFKTLDICNGCGICKKVCPTMNIVIVNKKISHNFYIIVKTAWHVIIFVRKKQSQQICSKKIFTINILIITLYRFNISTVS